ncbi:tail sheath monomer [Xanthomonas phage FoX2]|uniref:Tail sheath monomer n=2 Tax=Foxunavirus TaxID=2948712 RepID=A0A858NMU5_9CAUD|nr:tail sheath monomer [Xanthomonas phage FoX2]YP_010106807.1 tail sheath monomer [Xanthomonas phage FoX3]QJB21839.1 tail sheath monomer [Xanthomonas phage FoX2]QJB21920.1 tail sheath monomer [Xanthomonas phage FoX3]
MADNFLHGVEVLNIDDGARPLQTASTSVVGIVGTAPRADASVFPLNTPVMVAGSRSKAAKLLSVAGDDDGTLPSALDTIFDQAGAAVIVVRVAEGQDDTATRANVIGGANPETGAYEGVHALLAAQSVTGFKPRILLAPGFTHQRVQGGVTGVTLSNQGAGYTVAPSVSFTGGGAGSGALATAVLGTGANAGRVIAIMVTNPGRGYTSAPAVVLTGGTPTTPAVAAASIGNTANPVVAELIGIADRMRATIMADGPSTNDEDAISYAGDFGSKRVYLVDPRSLKTGSDGTTVPAWSSAVAAGLLVKSDNERGWWWSPSNQTVNGIIGTERAIDFAMGDYTSRANLLNEQNVATIIRQNGFRLWGNRTLSDDPKWQFLSVVRTADIIADTLQEGHLWAVDRGITKNYVEDVREGVLAKLRQWTALGAILGGDCWFDPDLNTAESIANGQVFWDFDFTPVYNAEHLTFRMHLTNDYVSEIY